MKNKYLTFNHINKFKGLLIILVIFGHIKGMTTGVSQNVLYSFHVSSFLILPFLFNTDKLTRVNLFKVFRRYFIPYFIFFTILFFLYHFIFHKEIDIIDFFYSLLFGTAHLLREQIGISAYWFFPALIFLLVTIMVYNTLSSNLKVYFIIFMVTSHLMIGVFSLPSEILQFAPFNFYITFYLFAIGLIIKYILNYFHLKTVHYISIIIVFIILLILSYGGRFNLASPYIPSIITRPYDFVLRDMIMILGFFSILYISKYFGIFSSFGKYSISLYTIHPFIIQIMNKLITSTYYPLLIIKLILVVLISYGITLLIYKLNINKVFYPK